MATLPEDSKLAEVEQQLEEEVEKLEEKVKKKAVKPRRCCLFSQNLTASLYPGEMNQELNKNMNMVKEKKLSYDERKASFIIKGVPHKPGSKTTKSTNRSITKYTLPTPYTFRTWLQVQ